MPWTTPLARGTGGRVLLAFAGARGRLYQQVRRDGYPLRTGDRVAGLTGIPASVWRAGRATKHANRGLVVSGRPCVLGASRQPPADPRFPSEHMHSASLAGAAAAPRVPGFACRFERHPGVVDA